jgi:hypothetical protein
MRRDAGRCATRQGSARFGSARFGSARLGSARLGTEKTPLRLLLRNRGIVFQCYSFCMAQIRHNILLQTCQDAVSILKNSRFFCSK